MNTPNPTKLTELVGVLVHDRMPVDVQCYETVRTIDALMGTDLRATVMQEVTNLPMEDRLEALIDETDRAIDALNGWLPDGFVATQADGEFWLLACQDDEVYA
jgi:hypothetical protein